MHFPSFLSLVVIHKGGSWPPGAPVSTPDIIVSAHEEAHAQCV